MSISDENYKNIIIDIHVMLKKLIHMKYVFPIKSDTYVIYRSRVINMYEKVAF